MNNSIVQILIGNNYQNHVIFYTRKFLYSIFLTSNETVKVYELIELRSATIIIMRCNSELIISEEINVNPKEHRSFTNYHFIFRQLIIGVELVDQVYARSSVQSIICKNLQKLVDFVIVFSLCFCFRISNSPF